MLFNSPEFLAFFVLVMALYAGPLARVGWPARKLYLTVVSYLFYMSWSPPFGLLLLSSTVIDFGVALLMERAATMARKRLLLLVSLSFNLGMLGFFKYGGFVADNVYRWNGWVDPPLLDLVLPVGISFYTFESLSYTVDVYRGERACRSFLDFALFLSFFPHLVAGPIVRPRDFLPQLEQQPAVDWARIELALARIAQGFAKKVVLADTLGLYVDPVLHLPLTYGSPNILLAIYAYTFQIYFDFSGYSDIALGLAQLFGLRLPENFDRPYLAENPRAFWQRWHISLSTWLRDYLYVSLGGNRRGTARTYVNLFLTMLLGGLWHGAAWNFIVWGAFHGVLLVTHRLWVAVRGERAVGGGRRWLHRVGTFHLVALGWMFFRAHTLDTVWFMLQRLGTWNWEPSKNATMAAIIVGVGVVLHVLPPAGRVRDRFTSLPPWVQGVVYGVGLVFGFLLSPASERFIYFQF